MHKKVLIVLLVGLMLVVLISPVMAQGPQQPLVAGVLGFEYQHQNYDVWYARWEPGAYTWATFVDNGIDVALLDEVGEKVGYISAENAGTFNLLVPADWNELEEPHLVPKWSPFHYDPVYIWDATLEEAPAPERGTIWIQGKFALTRVGNQVVAILPTDLDHLEPQLSVDQTEVRWGTFTLKADELFRLGINVLVEVSLQ